MTYHALKIKPEIYSKRIIKEFLSFYVRSDRWIKQVTFKLILRLIVRQGKRRFSWVGILPFQLEKRAAAKARCLNVAVC